MAVKSKKKTSKPKKKAIELTLWDVVLSYPDLNDPKPYKGKIYYRVDCIMDEDSQTLKEIKRAVRQVCINQWGEDKTEWPSENIKGVQDGNEREDQQGYADKFFVTASTQTPVPVVDLKGKPFNAQSVKGGMYGNVAVRVSAWEFDGDEGLSIYLQGVQVDTQKPGLNFGGGKSVKQMFNRDDEDEGDDEDQDDEDTDEEDEDEAPRRSKKKCPSRDEDEDESDDEESEDEDDVEDEDEEPAPRKKKPVKKKASRNFDDEDDDLPPRKKKKRPARDEDEEDDE